MLKGEIRILGIDDAPFSLKQKKVALIGTIFRGGKFLDGILKCDVNVDGNDATKNLVNMINNSRHKPQLKIIMLDGITVGGFNVIDIKELNEKVGLPVIVVNRKIPNLAEVEKALKKFKDFKERWHAVKNAGKIKECKLKDTKIYYQCVGIEDEDAEETIRLSATHGNIPEPLRVAHLIATGITRGESFGRA